MPITTQGSFRIKDRDTNMPQFEVNNPYHSQGLAAGGSALLDAINRGKVHLAKFILDAGESNVVNTRDFKGKTSLIRACYIKEEKTRGKAIELLLGKEADVNCQDDVGRTALSYACEMRANDVVRILVKNNVDPDIADDKGNTPLIYSAIVGNDMAIEILIRSFRRLGLNVDHINNEGLTALLISAKNGFTECASILALDGKACVSFRDREKGMNAEEWARSQGCTTPEVLPFSPQAALLGYRYSRIDDEAGAAGGSLSPKDDRPPRISPPGSGRRRTGRPSSSKQFDLEEVNQRLETVTCSGPKSRESKKVQTSPQTYEPLVRGRHKRSSLPSIKFSGFFSSYSHDRRERKSNAQNVDNSTLSADPDSGYHAGDSSPNMEEIRRGARRKSRDVTRPKSKSPSSSARHRKKSHDKGQGQSDQQEVGMRRPSTNLASASKIDVDLDSTTSKVSESGCSATE